MPALAIWGTYVAITLEFKFNAIHVRGPMAILIGLGLIALAALLLAFILWRDGRRFEKDVRDS